MLIRAFNGISLLIYKAVTMKMREIDLFTVLPVNDKSIVIMVVIILANWFCSIDLSIASRHRWIIDPFYYAFVCFASWIHPFRNFKNR